MKKKVDGWNISVQMALKKYIYDRIMRAAESSNAHERKKTQIIAQQKTIAVTAIWHGLYPGYFLAFFHWTLILQISQELFRI
jgi:lysophospholipid acyltransferase